MVEFSAENEHQVFDRVYGALAAIVPRRKGDPDIYLSRSWLETRYHMEIDRGSSEPSVMPILLCREIIRQLILDTKKALIDTLSEAEKVQREYLSDYGIRYGFRAQQKPLRSADGLRQDFIGLDRKLKLLASDPTVPFGVWSDAVNEYDRKIEQLAECIASINAFNVACGKVVDDKRRLDIAVIALKVTAAFSSLTFIYRVLDDIATEGGMFYWRDQLIFSTYFS